VDLEISSEEEGVYLPSKFMGGATVSDDFEALINPLRQAVEASVLAQARRKT
jgi:hypothetical protein